MKAINKLQKALSKNYYLTFIASIRTQKKFNYNIFVESILYKGEEYYEMQLDKIREKSKKIINNIKPNYYDALKEIYFEIAKYKSKEEKLNFLSNLRKVFEVSNLQLSKDILIDENHSNYYSKINDLPNFKSFKDLTNELYMVINESTHNDNECFKNDYYFELWKLKYYNIRTQLLGFLPTSLLAISNSFIKEIDNLIFEIETIENTSNIKWITKPTQLGFIFGELAALGYIEPPKKPNGDINYSAFARELKIKFNCDCSPLSLSKYLSPDDEKSQESKRKFKSLGYQLPHTKSVS